MAVKVVVTKQPAHTPLTAAELEVGKLYHVVQPASVKGCIVLAVRGWPIVIAAGGSTGTLGSVASNTIWRYSLADNVAVTIKNEA